jgi:hypothetical protein
MDAEKRAQLIDAVRNSASIEDVYEVLDISPTSPEAMYVEIMWEALC